MAGAEGLEPSTKVLETHVLPLHHAPAEHDCKYSGLSISCQAFSIGKRRIIAPVAMIAQDYDTAEQCKKWIKALMATLQVNMTSDAYCDTLWRSKIAPLR